jgi:ubiquinone/menaquinone biosynthesis C-methylase UbiE
VDIFWEHHTVNSNPFQSAEESLKYLEWRAEEYPLFHEHMRLWGEHDQETILDYGCGPGNDLVGFLAHTTAKRVIGIDISAKALELAAQRLALHHFDLNRFKLIRINDSMPYIPLRENSIDYIYCEGVLHHVSFPLNILHEFQRVLKPGGRGNIMVYNRNSLWFHLYTVYEKMILTDTFPGLSMEDAFSRNTDGIDCPISRCYRADEFIDLCRQSGFEVEFVGGYFNRTVELCDLEKRVQNALQDERLPDECRLFLSNLIYDNNGYPNFKGKHAGVGGIYTLEKKRKCS